MEHAARPGGLTQRGSAPLDFPPSPVAGAAGKGAQQPPHLGLEVNSVKGSLRRHPRPVPFHGLRPPVTPLTLPEHIGAEIVLVSVLMNRGTDGKFGEHRHFRC